MTITEGPKLFKVLGAEGQAIHGGAGTWLLPQGDRPAEWMPPIEGRIAACKNGYHLTPKPIDFYLAGSRVFEAEWQGDADDEQIAIPTAPKVAVRECRLLREVDWGEFCVWFDGEHSLSDGVARAYGSATVRAYGSATVEAYGSATVRAYGSATVRAYGSATVEAYGSATVEASGSATVEAYDSATVQASGSATVRAYGSATVEASDSATVEASDSATVQAYGSATVISTIYHSRSATVALADLAAHVDRRDSKLELRRAEGKAVSA